MQTESSKNTGPTLDAGETCERSPQSQPTNGKSMSSAADSRAKTSAAQANAKESMDSDQDCGRSCCEPFAYYDPESQSLRTCQRSLFEDWIPFSATLPRAGTMRNGRLWARPNSGRITYGKESSFWPTPQASDGFRGKLSLASLTARAKKCKTEPRLAASGCRVLGQELADLEELCHDVRISEWLMGFPIGWTDCEDAETQ